MDRLPPPTLVTVAIPTYRRPDLLRRALECIAEQSHRSLEVLVADNATEGGAVDAVVESFRGRIPGLVYRKQPVNIGAVANFFDCLDRARGTYFMWLADDDELSPAAVEALAAVLDRDPAAVTAVPAWMLRTGPDTGHLMPAREYASDRWMIRVVKFVWRSNDAFFYALHRTEVLRRARRLEYSWPNRGLLLNWAYPYLLDLVLAGKVRAVDRPDVVWINHDYSEKTYARPSGGIGNRLRTVARRVNVHVLYVRKVWAFAGPLAAGALLPVSLLSLVTELTGVLWRRLRRAPRAAAPVVAGEGSAR